MVAAVDIGEGGLEIVLASRRFGSVGMGARWWWGGGVLGGSGVGIFD